MELSYPKRRGAEIEGPAHCNVAKQGQDGYPLPNSTQLNEREQPRTNPPA